MCPEDTSPDAWKKYLDVVRRMTPGERLSRCLELSEKAGELAKAELRRRYPASEEREIFLRFACLKLGPELFRKAYQVEPFAERADLPPMDMDEFRREADRLGRVELLERARQEDTR